MPNLDNEILKSKLDITRLKTKLSQLSSVINSLDLDTVLKELDVLVQNQESIASATQEPVHNLVVKDRLLDEILNTKEKLDNLIKEYNLLNNTSYTITDLQKQHHKEVKQKQFIKDYFTSRNKEVLSVDIINNCFKNLAHEEILTLLNVVDNDYANVSLSDFSSAKLDIIRQEIKHILSLLRSKLLTYNKNNHTNYSLYNAPKEVINKFVNTKKNTIYSYLKDENGVFYSQDEVALVWPMLSSAQLESIIAYLGKEYTTNAVINPDVDKRVRDSFYRSIAKLKKLLKEARQNPDILRQPRRLKTIYDYFKDENGNLLLPESVDCILDNLTNQAHLNAIISYLGADFKNSSASQLDSNSKEYKNFYRTVSFLLQKAKKILSEYNNAHQTNYTFADLSKIDIQIKETKNIYDYFKDENSNPLPEDIVDYILNNFASEANLKAITVFLGPDFKTVSVPQTSFRNKEYSNFYRTKNYLIKKAKEILEQYNTSYHTSYTLADLTKIPSSYLKKEINSICKQNLKSIYDYFKDENGNPLSKDTVDYILDNFASEINLKNISNFLGADFKSPSPLQKKSAGKEYISFKQTVELLQRRATKFVAQYNHINSTNYTLSTISQISTKVQSQSVYDYFKDEKGDLLSTDVVDYILDNFASETNLKNISNYFDPDFQTSVGAQKLSQTKEYSTFHKTKDYLIKKSKEFLEQYNATNHTSYTLADLTKISFNCPEKKNNNTSSKDIHVNQELKSIYDYFKDENSKPLSKDTVDYILDNFASEINLKNISNFLGPDFKTPSLLQKKSTSKEYSVFKQTIVILQRRATKFVAQYNQINSTNYTLSTISQISTDSQIKSIYNYFKDENGNLLSKDTVDYILDNLASEANLKTINNYFDPEFQTPVGPQTAFRSSEYHAFCKTRDRLIKRAKNIIDQYNTTHQTSYTLADLPKILISDPEKENNNTVSKNTDVNKNLKSIYDYFKAENGNLLSKDTIDYILDNLASEANLKTIINLLGPDFKTPSPLQKKSTSKEYSAFQQTIILLRRRTTKFLEQYNQINSTNYTLSTISQVSIERQNQSIYDYFKDEKGNLLSKENVDYILANFTIPSNLKSISKYLGADFKTPKKHPKNTHSGQYQAFNQTIFNIIQKVQKFLQYYNQTHQTSYTLSDLTNSSFNSKYLELQTIHSRNINKLSTDEIVYKIKELQFYKNQLLEDVEFLNLLKNDSRFNYLAQKVGETQAILTFLHLGYYTNNPLSVKHLASLFDINNYALQQSLKNSLAILKEYYENAQSIVKTKTIGE